MNKPVQTATELLRQGQPARAIPYLRAAISAAPNNAGLHHDLGLACLECGQLAEAAHALQRAIAINPRYADAHLRLGIVLECANNIPGALAQYRQGNTADANYRAGDLLESLGRTQEAVAAFRRASAAAPRTALGRIAAAKTALLDNNDAEAEKKLRQTLALDRENPVALELLGNVLAENGRFAEAEPIFAQAARTRPGASYELVRCRRLTEADAQLIAQLRETLARPDLDPVARARLHLALGKAAEDLNDYADAMRHFDAAQIMRDAICGFNLARFADRAERQISLPAAVFDTQTGPATGPIVILGLPRSGTTLLEQMLSAHPMVAAGGESPFWSFCGPELDSSGPYPPSAEDLAQAAAGYEAALRRVAAAPSRVTDKMPLNFLWTNLIALARPDALIVHCRRNRLDTALSIHATWFNVRMPFPTGGEALVAYIRLYERLMTHWRRSLPENRFVEILYEDLVTDPAPHLRRVLDACGLPWYEACLHPESNTRAVRTPSKWQARQRLHGNAIGKSRLYRPWLGPLAALDE
jgi:tetratricopeptide (TPR) repeat protein